MGKHLSKYSSEADYNNNKDTHLKPHVSLITTSPKKIKFEKKILVNLITFYIDNIQCQAEEGMTWADWYISDMCNEIISKSLNPPKDNIYNYLDNVVIGGAGWRLLYNNKDVKFGDYIQKEYNYQCDISSGDF